MTSEFFPQVPDSGSFYLQAGMCHSAVPVGEAKLIALLQFSESILGQKLGLPQARFSI
jgi:hypothetical protein